MSDAAKSNETCVAHLLLAGPFVPNVERLLERHEAVLGIPKSIYFEAYDFSITVPHADGVLRFQLLEKPFESSSIALSDLPKHTAHLTINATWPGDDAVAIKKHACVVIELLDQLGDAATVVWSGKPSAAAEFRASSDDGTLAVPIQRGRSNPIGSHAKANHRIKRFLGLIKDD